MISLHKGLAWCWLAILVIGVGFLIFFGEDGTQKAIYETGLNRWLVAVLLSILLGTVALDVKRQGWRAWLHSDLQKMSDFSLQSVAMTCAGVAIFYAVSIIMIFDLWYGYPIGKANADDWLYVNFWWVLGLALCVIPLWWVLAQFVTISTLPAVAHDPQNAPAFRAEKLSAEEQNALEILALEYPYTLEELKAQRKKITVKVHPDQGGSAFLLRQVEDAYQLLKSKL